GQPRALPRFVSRVVTTLRARIDRHSGKPRLRPASTRPAPPAGTPSRQIDRRAHVVPSARHYGDQGFGPRRYRDAYRRRMLLASVGCALAAASLFLPEPWCYGVPLALTAGLLFAAVLRGVVSAHRAPIFQTPSTSARDASVVHGDGAGAALATPRANEA